ncbi:MAG: methyltransferase domain-containing protein [Candidatus Marinimicrobia bacterium]|nr:methyltransferase domain-containing protein [Candidatus Neomarinimicrobiota bacterium]MCF7828384.1 methyltransferase domain-containing protein [Candidatus Neomarinimicrobiota bacterium]MCF7881022.1 methyltransferase domain-containing protein [Candidatus Neomarinimicrobiota bacterium]
MCNTAVSLPETNGGTPGFDEWYVTAINNGAVMLMISIGHRTGLFDTLADMEWTTSQELAEEAGLNERYVREWLGTMATGGIVDVDESDRYHLPADHGRFLTRQSADENLAAFAQYISLLGGTEDEIVDCFQNGGGVSYDKYPRFHEIMAEDSGMTVLDALEEDILPLVPELEANLWKGIEVLDVGCGRGLALMKMAQLFPNSRFTGIDISKDAISWARSEAAKRDLGNVVFEMHDASDFDRTAEPEVFDFVTTFDAIHDQADPLAVLTGIHRTLKPDGVYLMQDIHAQSPVHENLDHPLGPFLYTISGMHCMPVSLAQGGAGLGAMWGREKAKELLNEAGFNQIEIHRLEHDIQNDYYVNRK